MEENADLCRSGQKLQEQNNFVGELIADLNRSKDDVAENHTMFLKVNETRWSLKHRMIHLMSYYEFLLQLKEDPEKWTKKETVDKKVEGMIAEHTKQKTNFKELSEKIKSLETVLENAENVFQQKSEIDNELEEIKKKKIRFEELKGQYDRKLEIFEGKCKTHSEATKLIESQKKSIEERLQQINAIEIETKSFQTHLSLRDQEILARVESFFTTEKVNEQCHHSDLMKCQDYLVLYEKMSGVKVKSKDGDSVKIELNYGPDGTSSVPISLQYAKQKPPYPTKLIEVKIENCNIFTEDLISQAISSNDFGRVIPALKHRLETNISLAEEIEELRKLSAVDWIPEKKCLFLIVGPRTCTLAVPDGYPGVGQVTLTEVQGHGEKDLKQLKPLAKEPTLTDWVNYLELHLNN